MVVVWGEQAKPAGTTVFYWFVGWATVAIVTINFTIQSLKQKQNRLAIHEGVAKRVFLHDNDNSDKKIDCFKVKTIAMFADIISRTLMKYMKYI